MAFGDLIPFTWGANRRSMPMRREEEFPFTALQSSMNRLFENFFGDMPLFGSSNAGEQTGAFSPRIRLSEDDKSVTLEAELPGLSEKDIDLALTKDRLTLRGEKRIENERKGTGNSLYSEVSYGAFERSIPLNFEVDEDKVEATFKNGVLSIVLPKTAQARSQTKKISVRAS